jgi:hypothetical protein
MRIQIPELEAGTKVKIRKPGPGERGEWVVRGRVLNSGADDPAYQLGSVSSGRSRIIRRSRLKLLRAHPAAPGGRRGQSAPAARPHAVAGGAGMRRTHRRRGSGRT